MRLQEPCQWFWDLAETSDGEIAHWVNPGDGFALGATTWTDIQTALTSTGHDLAFALFGADCPDPIDEDCAASGDEDLDGLDGCADFDCVFYEDCVDETYSETNDSGNNAVQWSWSDTDVSWAGPGSDEASGFTLTPGNTYMFSGSVVDNGEYPTADNDDHDSFRFNTGTAADMLIGLDLEGTGNDCDVLITSTTGIYLVGPGQVANGSSDTLDDVYEEVWSVLAEGGSLSPGTDYLINVGAFHQTSSSYPADYELFIYAL